MQVGSCSCGKKHVFRLTCCLFALAVRESAEDTEAKAETLENEVQEDDEGRTEEAVVKVTRHQDKKPDNDQSSSSDNVESSSHKKTTNTDTEELSSHKLQSGDSKGGSGSAARKSEGKSDSASGSEKDATLGKGYSKDKPGFDAEYKSEQAVYKDEAPTGGAEAKTEKFSASGGHQVNLVPRFLCQRWCLVHMVT